MLAEARGFRYSNTSGAANTFLHKFLNYFTTLFIEYVDHVYVHLNKTHKNFMGVPFIFPQSSVEHNHIYLIFINHLISSPSSLQLCGL